MQFSKTYLKEAISIKSIRSLHYFEFSKDYIFEGEKHDFWEFLYVDKGEVEVMADSTGLKLKHGDIIFHKPNEFHSVWANKQIAPNLIVLSFDCKSPAIKYFENKIFCLGDMERNLLASIIQHGKQAFRSALDNPKVNTLARNEQALPGVEQMIKINLELLLLRILARGQFLTGKQRLSTSAKERTEEDIFRRITEYMEHQSEAAITISSLCSQFHLSRTHIIALFHEKVGQSVMKYCKTFKIEQAKKMIREETSNFTEISELLHYSSIHSFSRQFKNITDMTPSEYAKSIKAKSQ